MRWAPTWSFARTRMRLRPSSSRGIRTLRSFPGNPSRSCPFSRYRAPNRQQSKLSVPTPKGEQIRWPRSYSRPTSSAFPNAEAPGRTVREVLESIFLENSPARSYVLDDQSGLRKHMTIFIDGRMIRDRARLGDAVTETSTIYVLQALSGG